MPPPVVGSIRDVTGQRAGDPVRAGKVHRPVIVQVESGTDPLAKVVVRVPGTAAVQYLSFDPAQPLALPAAILVTTGERY